MKLSDYIKHYASTTEWAKWQDRVFSGTIPTMVEILKWTPLALAHENLCGPSNLSIRHLLIRSAFAGTDPERIAWLSRASEHRLELIRHKAWLEGPSYFIYTETGAGWYAKITGKLPWDSDEIAVQYASIVAPDGTIPTAEARAEEWVEPDSEWNTVSSPSYFCKRWVQGGKVIAYVLVCLDATPTPCRNLHHHLDAGYCAIWIRGKWHLRCKPYEGFNIQESFTSSALYGRLPKGALPELWRARPPAIGVVKTEDGFRFDWDNGLFRKAWRKIRLLPDRIIVEDKASGLFGKKQVAEYSIAP